MELPTPSVDLMAFIGRSGEDAGRILSMPCERGAAGLVASSPGQILVYLYPRAGFLTRREGYETIPTVLQKTINRAVC
jgi:hypothetical protein